MKRRWSVVLVMLVMLMSACSQREESPRAIADTSPKSAETPWVAARSPEGLSLLEAPA